MRGDDKAASPVIGVLLMVGVVVILFGVALSMIHEIGTSTDDLHFHAGPGEPFPRASHEQAGGSPQPHACRVPALHGLRCVFQNGVEVESP